MEFLENRLSPEKSKAPEKWTFLSLAFYSMHPSLDTVAILHRRMGLPPFIQERKVSPKRKFLGRTSRGHPGVIRADVPAQNFGQGSQNPGKTSISARTSMTRLGADVHDPKGFPKASVRKTLG